ncbi:MAG TPA: transglycosylase domain-containing protein [Nocardioides sp.]|uniref:transglycosylase domain-containing protein n=1 Tax=Nocardioides sp. TaxID=35761 RepID=UPI002D80A684|nr:transglycosylase domain-containing protein [Nocardioides sp.]HET6652187.1 transglycosylase domain-containing protein [Nocardioides sp.]
MPSRRTDKLKPASVISHLGVMVAVAGVMGVLVAGLAIPFAGVAGLGARDVARSMDKIPADLAAEPLPQRSRLLAADGSVLATLFDENRVNVPLASVAPIMRKAIISIEDYRFYQHGALDLRGTLRAFVTNEVSDATVQGGSSITQQMVKMTLLNQAETDEERLAATDDTYERKIRELRYAIAFEEKYSKDWILERYLNIAYFGDGAHGIQAASRHYFSKPASRLNLRQAALLAGLVKNPTAYDPTNDPERARDRRDVVLNRMLELNVISQTEADRAMRRGLGLDVTPSRNGCVSSRAPFFCDFAVQYLMADRSLGKSPEERRSLLYSGGLTVKTTINPRFQRAADRSVRSHVFPTDQAIGGLAMVQPGSGEVRALSQSRPMGGNKRKGETYLNYVVPAKYGDANGFQAGSTFKVFVLASAIKQGIPLSTQISAPQTVSLPNNSFRTCDGPLASTDVWSPENSTGAGTYDLYSGTQTSVNTFFAQLEQRTGLCAPVTLARQMGITVPEDDVVPPFTLGVTNTDPLTMAGAYATFAARGVYCAPRPVTEILNSNGKAIQTYPQQCRQLLPTAVADAVNDVLRGVQEPGGFGYGAGINLSQPSAGKTGTINENMSVWFIGYTPDLATASMIAGANSKGEWITLNGQTIGGQFVASAFGSTNAGPMWGDAMKAIEPMLPDTNFSVPDPTAIQGRLVTVPSVYGFSPSSAAEVLRRSGLNPVVGPMVNSSNSYGSVAYLSPGSGTQVGTGSTITMYISNGVPDTPPPPPPSDDDDDDDDNSGPGNGNGNGRGNGRGGDDD